MFFRLVFIIMLFFMASCIKTNKNLGKEIESVNDMLNAFDKEIKLNAEIYINDSTNLLEPFSLNIFGNYLLVNDIGDSEGNLLSVYNMDNKKFIGRMCRRGNGPNEFLGFRMNVYEKDSLLVLDPYKKRALIYSKNEIEMCRNEPVRIISFQSPKSGEQISQCYLFNDKVICSGQFNEGRFQIYDKNGRFLDEFGDYPFVSFNETQIDNLQLGYVFGSDVSFCNDTAFKKMACVNSSTFSMYDYNGENKFSNKIDIQWFKPKIGEAIYKDGKPYVTMSAKDCMVGAGNMVAGKEYIFFTFSNYSVYEIISKGINDPLNIILVLNWEGEAVAKLRLSKAVRFPLVIDNDENYLYSIHTDLQTGFPQIVRYDISFLNITQN